MISSGGEAYSMKEKKEILQSFVAEMKKHLENPLKKLFCMVLMREVIIGKTQIWIS